MQFERRACTLPGDPIWRLMDMAVSNPITGCLLAIYASARSGEKTAGSLYAWARVHEIPLSLPRAPMWKLVRRWAKCDPLRVSTSGTAIALIDVWAGARARRLANGVAGL